jgi:hypothetical protein
VIVCADLKEVAAPTAPAKSYSAPKLQHSELPSVVAMTNFRKPATIPTPTASTPVDYPFAVKTPKATFRKIHSSVATLPKRRTISAPDPSSAEIVWLLQNPNV